MCQLVLSLVYRVPLLFWLTEECLLIKSPKMEHLTVFSNSAEVHSLSQVELIFSVRLSSNVTLFSSFAPLSWLMHNGPHGFFGSRNYSYELESCLNHEECAWMMNPCKDQRWFVTSFSSVGQGELTEGRDKVQRCEFSLLVVCFIYGWVAEISPEVHGRLQDWCNSSGLRTPYLWASLLSSIHTENDPNAILMSI